MGGRVLDWARAFEAGPERCGGKGYNLARLARYGFPVPAGGVLTAEIYREALREEPVRSLVAELGRVGAGEVDGDEISGRLRAVREAISARGLPGEVATELQAFLEREGLSALPLAVRSSAVGEDGAELSFAGLHRSFLGVRGTRELEEAILGCFASLWTPRALAYRRRMRVPDEATRCAVVVQTLVRTEDGVEPRCAGIAFSSDPRKGRRDLIVIEGAAGEGERVVSGELTPDRIVVQIAEGEFRTVETSREGEGILSSGEALELARQVWRVQWALSDGDTPQDVEWAHDGRRLWLLQARPITRLPRYTHEGARRLPVIWSTANIKDAFPGVATTLSWSLIQQAIDGVLYGAARASGVPVPSGLESLRRFRGRAYFDLTAMQWYFYDAFGVLPSELAEELGGHQPEIPVPEGNPLAGREGRRRRTNSLRLLRRMARLSGRIRRLRREFGRDLEELQRVELSRAPGLELLSLFERLGLLYRGIQGSVALANARSGPYRKALKALVAGTGGERASLLLAGLLSGGGGVPSAEIGYRLWDLAETARGDPVALAWLGGGGAGPEWRSLPEESSFKRELRRYLSDFGHRAVYEGELENPRWSEDPTYLLDQVRAHLAAPGPSPREAAGRARRRARAELEELSLPRRLLVGWLARRLQRAFAVREEAKSLLVSGLPLMRRIVLEVGRRLVREGFLDCPDKVFHLAQIDLVAFLAGDWDGRGADALASDRERQREEWLRDPEPPDVIVEGGEIETLTPEPALDRPSEGGWTGIGVSSGRAEGPARVLRHPAEGRRLAPGEVLVAPSTDPGWSPLLLRAGAIVTETGGFLSHGAIIAREYGIPAVVNVAGILQELEDGDVLAVDGDLGRVKLVGTPDARGRRPRS